MSWTGEFARSGAAFRAAGLGIGATGQLESLGEPVDLGRLALRLGDRPTELLDQRGIVLGNLVHAADRRVHLGDRGRPAAGRIRYGCRQRAVFAHGLKDRGEFRGGPSYQSRAGATSAPDQIDQRLDLGRGLRGRLGELADFDCDDRKPFARFARSGLPRPKR